MWLFSQQAQRRVGSGHSKHLKQSMATSMWLCGVALAAWMPADPECMGADTKKSTSPPFQKKVKLHRRTHVQHEVVDVDPDSAPPVGRIVLRVMLGVQAAALTQRPDTRGGEQASGVGEGVQFPPQVGGVWRDQAHDEGEERDVPAPPGWKGRKGFTGPKHALE